MYYSFHAAKNNTMMIKTAGLEQVNIPTIEIDVVDENGLILHKGLQLTKIGVTNIFKTTFIPPGVAFKLLLRGK